MAYYDALIAKWATLSPGTTQQRLGVINALTENGPAQPMIVPTYAIYNLIDPADWQAASAANQQLLRDILSMGTVDASPGTSVRSRVAAIFGVGTATRTALTALAAKYDTPQIPWWQSAGYSSPINSADLSAAGLS